MAAGNTAGGDAGTPSHLNLAQIFDALSSFSDHADEIQRYIKVNRLPTADSAAGAAAAAIRNSLNSR
jgi:hypothetical protein